MISAQTQQQQPQDINVNNRSFTKNSTSNPSFIHDIMNKHHQTNNDNDNIISNNSSSKLHHDVCTPVDNKRICSECINAQAHSKENARLSFELRDAIREIILQEIPNIASRQWQRERAKLSTVKGKSEDNANDHDNSLPLDVWSYVQKVQAFWEWWTNHSQAFGWEMEQNFYVLATSPSQLSKTQAKLLIQFRKELTRIHPYLTAQISCSPPSQLQQQLQQQSSRSNEQTTTTTTNNSHNSHNSNHHNNMDSLSSDHTISTVARFNWNGTSNHGGQPSPHYHCVIIFNGCGNPELRPLQQLLVLLAPKISPTLRYQFSYYPCLQPSMEKNMNHDVMFRTDSSGSSSPAVFQYEQTYWLIRYRSPKKTIDVRRLFIVGEKPSLLHNRLQQNSDGAEVMDSSNSEANEPAMILQMLDELIGEDATECYIGKIPSRVKYVPSTDAVVQYVEQMRKRGSSSYSSSFIDGKGDELVNVQQLFQLITELHEWNRSVMTDWVMDRQRCADCSSLLHGDEMYQVSKIHVTKLSSSSSSSSPPSSSSSNSPPSNQQTGFIGYHHLNTGLRRILYPFHDMHCTLVFKYCRQGAMFQRSLIEDLRLRFSTPELMAIHSWANVLQGGVCNFFTIDTVECMSTILNFLGECQNAGWEVQLSFTHDFSWENLEIGISKKVQSLYKELREYQGLAETNRTKKNLKAVRTSSQTRAQPPQSQGPSPKIKQTVIHRCSTCKKTFFISNICPFCRSNEVALPNNKSLNC